MKPKVSVCMVAYMHEAYIRQAIESVLSQNVDFPIELVIGVDCSPDGTAAICYEIAARDHRVRVINREKNLGMSLNGIQTLIACEGEYIAICEGDDYWTDPHKLHKQVQFLDKHPDYAGATHQSMIIIDNKAVRRFKENVPSTLTMSDMIGGRLFHTASLMFRRPTIDLFIKAPPVHSGDRLFNLCISFLGKVHYLSECMCAYRLHGGGISSNVSVEQLKMDLNCIPYLKQLHPAFPKYRYLAYVYATIGLCRAARFDQRLYYLSLFFIFSFANFPGNLFFIVSRLARLTKVKPNAL